MRLKNVGRKLVKDLAVVHRGNNQSVVSDGGVVGGGHGKLQVGKAYKMVNVE